jgi:hypothetical protein
MIDEYVLAVAAVVVVVFGRLAIARAERDPRFRIRSKFWSFVVLMVCAAIVGAGGVALADLLTRALGISSIWGVAFFVAVAVVMRSRRGRSVEP